MDGGYVYNYEDGVSYPVNHRPYVDGSGIMDSRRHGPKNPIFGPAIHSLSNETNYNLQKLKSSLMKVDPCYEYGVEHWHSEDRNNPDEGAQWNWNELPEHARPQWETTGNMFTSQAQMDKIDFRNIKTDFDPSSKENEPVPTCYLCTTLEEHERHMAKRGPQLKEKNVPKPRVKYFAPPPFVKPKEKEIDEKKECLFKVTVKTGSLYKSATSANVSITLQGQKRVMQKKTLTRTRASKFTFGVNTSEVFYIKGPNLGDLRYLIVEHDGLEQNHAWFLEYIEVHNMTSDRCWIFVCKNWLSLYDGDCKTKRRLKGQEKDVSEVDLRKTSAEFEISVVTANTKLAGTDANVLITLFGKKAFSPKLKLEHKGKQDPFESGAEDKFTVVTKDLGALTSIKLEHDNSGVAPGWLVEKVVIHDLGYDKVYHFPIGQWLATGEGDGSISRVFYPLTTKAKKKFNTKMLGSKGSKSSRGRNRYADDDDEDEYDEGSTVNYQVEVKTGHANYAGTDAKVYIQLMGKKKKSHEEYLPDVDGDKFEKGKTDQFQFRAVDVGDIKKIKLHHDNSGLGAGWLVEQVVVKKYFTKQQVKGKMAEAEDELKRHVARRVSKVTGKDIAEVEEDTDNRKSTSKNRRRRDRLSTVDEGDEEEMSRMRRGGRFSDDSSDTKHRKKGKKKKYEEDDSDSEEDSDDDQFKPQRIKRRVQKHYMIGNKEFVLTETESDSEDDRRARAKELKKKKKNKKRAGLDSDDSDNDYKGRKKGSKKHGKNKYDSDDSEEESDDDTAYRRRLRQQMKKYKNSDDESDDDSYRKRHRKHQKNRDDSDEESDEDHYKNRHRKQKKRHSDSDDSESDDDYKKKKNKKKYKDSSESDTDSDDKYRKKGKKKSSKYRDDSSDSDSKDSRRKPQTKPRRVVERDGLTTVYKKNRVPYYDEYSFVVNKWFAEDEGDGAIERILKPTSCTTFFKVKK